jgi:YD repeat-containing protein
MKRSLLFLPILAIILYSCQKEIDFGTGGSGGGGTTTGNRLVKTVSKTTSDSVITIYTYNGAGKLINVKTTGMSGGIDVSNEFKYYRNSSGIITRTVQINPNLVLVGIDSVITTVHYNTSTAKYTSDVFSLSLFGFSVDDSSAHVYDASGKLIRTDEYQAIPALGQPYELTLKSMYTYDAAGNVKQEQMILCQRSNIHLIRKQLR